MTISNELLDELLRVSICHLIRPIRTDRRKQLRCMEHLYATPSEL